MNNDFYDSLAIYYHLIFENWDKSIHEQGKIISALLRSNNVTGPILDCACGIGTQALALAALGYEVDATDLSSAEIERAKKEATIRKLSINFRVDDMRKLETSSKHYYGAVIAMDNALPHLNSDEEVMNALVVMKSRLQEKGTVLLSVRDYNKLIDQKPIFTEPRFFQDGEYRRIVHQVWDWQDERHYIVHLYISYETDSGWRSHHFVGNYRAITANEIATMTKKVGFVNVRIMEPSETGYYQMIILGNAP